jgi:ubiquinone/menaquinone biosynthesis C-methylase UbiE
MSAPADGSARWEAAYLRFESPREEVRKCVRRLRRLGVARWSRDLEVVEICCGRGSGLRAWHRLGFTRVDGVDISPELCARYDGPGEIRVGDVRALPLPDRSRDVVCVQGGLHHLATLDDLRRTLAEASRVLRAGGRLLVVEPWLTPFLRAVHRVSEVRLLRRLSPKVDALATMVELERPVYHDWLARPAENLRAIGEWFAIRSQRRALGKLELVAEKRNGRSPGGDQ